mmetsp:Transcript_1847/g.2583  ORF Transcript_1847/g.2583 Transcript_1847/m.2583 type:complete len:742 (-) Transcript_1847:96-2321(-)
MVISRSTARTLFCFCLLLISRVESFVPKHQSFQKVQSLCSRSACIAPWSKAREAIKRKPLFRSTSHLKASSENEEQVQTVKDPESQGIEWDKIIKQGKVFWEMSFPYFKESKSGRWLFAGMVVMTLINSGVSVAFSYIGKDFWNALSSKDPAQFYEMMTKFGAALVFGAPASVLYTFQRERLAVNWREWMTDRTLQLYSTDRVYYALERGKEIDNPDQRIAEDVRTFTAFSLQLFLTIVTSLIDLVSFSFILYSIQPQLFGAIIAYAAFGSIVTTFLGQSLVSLNFLKLQKEADFRYSLVRLRENAESIAFYAGEDIEGRSISERLSTVIENRKNIIGQQRNLEFFTTAYQYLIQIVPVAVVAPQYFAGSIQLGVVSQSSGAFNHILRDLSILVNQFEQLASFSAGIDRLSQFFTAIREVDCDRPNDSPLLELKSNETVATSLETAVALADEEFGSISLRRMEPMGDTNGKAGTGASILVINDLTLCTPDRKRVLMRDLNLDLKQGENLLIVGNSGAGKSSLLRGIAGLWTAGEGSVEMPANEDVYFLPQRPYCTLGSLKDQLLYPSLENFNTEDYPEGHRFSQAHVLRQVWTDEELLQILALVDLDDLPKRVGNGDPVRGLQAVADWSNMLSLGEQQRLAFGRVLVNQPRLVILDEATSALDMVSEAKMYSLLQGMGKKTIVSGGQLSAPGLTYISVGHRPSLVAFHDKRLRLKGEDKFELSDIEKSSADLEAFSNVSNL